MIAGGNHTIAHRRQGRRVKSNSSHKLQRAALSQRERSGSPLEGDEGCRSWTLKRVRIRRKYFNTAIATAPLISLSRTIMLQNRILRMGSDSFPSRGKLFPVRIIQLR